RITLSMHDHAPYAHAFDELALFTFLELLEDAGTYLDALHWASEAEFLDEAGEEPEDASSETPERVMAEAEDADAGGTKATSAPTGRKSFDLALALGYMVNSKVAGWRLFCERRTLPSFAVWADLPGFPRLQRALHLAEGAAFVAEGLARWLNGVR